MKNDRKRFKRFNHKGQLMFYAIHNYYVNINYERKLKEYYTLEGKLSRIEPFKEVE